MLTLALLALAGLLAGIMNAVAGGGSFVTLPALIHAGLPSTVANASSTAALLPGAGVSAWAFRGELRRPGQASLKALSAVSLAGGVVGAGLLLVTSAAAFDKLLPWLLLIASAALTFARPLAERLRGRMRGGVRVELAAQAALGVYGGYFGGAGGLLILATWAVLMGADVKMATPARVVVANAANLVALGVFVAARMIRWPQTLAMAMGALVGGWLGARIALSLPPALFRWVTLGVCYVVTAAFFLRAYL